MKIAVASDHGGFSLKQDVVAYLQEQGHEVKDFGCFAPERCDYPDLAMAAAKAVASGECERGIVMCSTGIGVSIAANKVPGIRCALCGDLFSAEMTRRHNNANMLAMGAFLTPIFSSPPSLSPADAMSAGSTAWRSWRRSRTERSRR